MKTQRLYLLGFTVLLLAVFIGGSVAWAGDTTMRWDIASVDFATGTVSEGGRAGALANDNSTIILTGSGTFVLEQPDKVTGGGNWTTFDPHGNPTGSGTYEVTGLVSFHEAPGTFPKGPTDLIGDPADARAGLVVLRISYSDKSQGVLTVSCTLVGTPDSNFEGITASKGSVAYWNRLIPIPGVDLNRTLYHVVREEE